MWLIDLSETIKVMIAIVVQNCKSLWWRKVNTAYRAKKNGIMPKYPLDSIYPSVSGPLVGLPK